MCRISQFERELVRSTGQAFYHDWAVVSMYPMPASAIQRDMQMSQAQERLVVCIAEALRAAAEETPLMQFRAIGVGFLQWSFANPAHFQVIFSCALIDYEGSRLRGSNDLIRVKMHELMRDAASQDFL